MSNNNKKVVVVVLIVVLLLLVGGMIAGFVVWKKKEDEAAQAIKDDEREEDRDNDESPAPPPPPPPTGDDPGGSPDDGSGTDGLGDGRSCITYEGQELCCPTGYDAYGDGSACVDGTDRCALYGNASLPRCPGVPEPTNPLDKPGVCYFNIGISVAGSTSMGRTDISNGRTCVATPCDTSYLFPRLPGAKPCVGKWVPQSGRCMWNNIIMPYHSQDECDAANAKAINEGKEGTLRWIPF